MKCIVSGYGSRPVGVTSLTCKPNNKILCCTLELKWKRQMLAKVDKRQSHFDLLSLTIEVLCFWNYCWKVKRWTNNIMQHVEQIGRKRSDLWKEHFWMLHQNNAHRTIPLYKWFFDKNSTNIIKQGGSLCPRILLLQPTFSFIVQKMFLLYGMENDWTIRWRKFIISAGAYFKDGKINLDEWVTLCDIDRFPVLSRLAMINFIHQKTLSLFLIHWNKKIFEILNIDLY